MVPIRSTCFFNISPGPMAYVQRGLHMISFGCTRVVRSDERWPSAKEQTKSCSFMPTIEHAGPGVRFVVGSGLTPTLRTLGHARRLFSPLCLGVNGFRCAAQAVQCETSLSVPALQAMSGCRSSILEAGTADLCHSISRESVASHYEAMETGKRRRWSV